MGFDVYLSWDGMTAEDERAQDILWDLRFGHTGYLRAALSMKSEISLLGEIFPDVPWWKGPPRQGNAKDYDFETNLQKMRMAAQKYLEVAGAKTDLSFLLSLPPRTKVPDPQDANLEREEIWVRSLVDFFNLGLKKQREGKHPKVEIT
jgi:hypothetical protein